MNPTTLDIAANRRSRNYSKREIFRRLLWSAGRLLFRFSPRPCFGWRRLVLRCFGATIGTNVNTYPSTWIYFPWNLKVGDWSAIGEEAFIYNLGPVTIGQKATISHRAQLCAGTHDYTRPELPLVKSAIVIQDQAWVCANAFVGPGVNIGEGAIIGACCVVTKTVAPWSIMAGNPAKLIKQRVLKGLD